MYGSTGVCKVVDIATPDLPGARKSYVLEPLHVANSKIYAPVDDNPVPMRSLLTPEEAQSLIDSLPEIQALPGAKEKDALRETCRGAIKSADCLLLARLLKTLYEKKQVVLQQKKIVPSAEKEYFDTAERILFGEIAAVLRIPYDEVKDYIETRTQRGQSGFAAVAS